MPKKEEILVKDDKLNKEKISENTSVSEKSKKAKTTKTASTTKVKKTTTSAKKTTTKKAEKVEKTEQKETKAKSATKTAAKTTKKTTKAAEVKKEPEKKAKTTKKTSEKVDKVIDEKKPKTTKTKKVEKVEKVKEEQKIDELSVIEKIKSFIAKIAAMQEEARKESLVEKEEKSNKKETKTTKERKTKSKAKTEKEVKKVEYMLEYYDLPYIYNETIVKILAQTPKRMFVYWDISDNDREKYIKTFGEDFFEKTYPVLLLYNEDKKYIREIQINDFANSWYIDIPDPKTKYSIQLGRKFRTYNEVVNINIQKVQENQIILHTDYLPFANSNVLEVPNDRVLLDKLPRFIKFRNVRTNEETMRELKDIKNIFGSNYDVKGFYEEHYKEELSEGMFDMANPSSNLSSSSFK